MRSDLFVACAALGLLGCATQTKVAPVSGKVTLNGRPLPNAVVAFQPVAGGKNPNPGPGSSGKTDAEGRYTLQLVGRPEAGAVVGEHRVSIVAYDGAVPATTDDANPVLSRQILPKKYNASTELTFKVPGAGAEGADFRLTSVVPVSGRVTLDGRPLPNAVVAFQPVGGGKNPDPGSSGTTDAEGRYTLRVVGRAEAGAAVGKYRVSIVAPQGAVPAAGEANPVPPRQLVPKKYNAATELTFEVSPEGAKAADFDLASAKKAAD